MKIEVIINDNGKTETLPAQTEAEAQELFEQANRDYGRETNEGELQAGFVKLEGGVEIKISKS